MRVHLRKWSGLAGVGALAAGMLAAGPMAGAAPSPSAAVVVNEVYGGGGNTGATLKQDFIELANVSSSAVDLTGWSVQYASAVGMSWALTALAGTLPAGATYVVREAQGSGGTVDIVGDALGTIPMSGSAGKVALVNNSTALPGTCTGKLGGAPCSSLPQVVDFVGYGTTANDFAGTGPTPAPSNTTSVSRDSAHTNTADNAVDFTAGAPTPSTCGTACVPPPPGPAEKRIADIQGTGVASDLQGQTISTHGVVTAAYPTGGFRGFYVQTQGTGPDPSETGASDGIFVFQPSGALDADAVVGNYVQVTGTVSEFQGLTELTAAATDIVDAGDSFSPVQALTIPWPTTDAGRESIEGMLYRPSSAYTVTNTFATNQFGEVGLAVGTTPLLQPTEVVKPAGANNPAVKAIEAENASRRVTLDDGVSTNYVATSSSTTTCGTRPTPCLVNGGLTPAYVSNSHPVRVGEAATFTAPVVVDYRFNLWRFQPTRPVVGPDSAGSPVSFEDTRTPAPDAGEIGSGDVRVASFNVLNYFTTLGDTHPDCVPFYDRDGSGNNVRSGCDQRGAWDAADFGRQQEKIVSAVNSLDADVVGLMEIENSAKFGQPRDTALAHLVGALNAKAGEGTWAYVPSSTELPPVDLQDFITNAIIYKPADVMRVGESRALGTASEEGQAFANAREPIAQVFKKKHGGTEKFLFVVNHFKSKGSAGPFPGDEDTGDGQGESVTSRILQAQALRDWVPTVQTETSTKAVVMAGDYNSYTMEDPLDVLYDAGYTDVGSRFECENADDPCKYSYSFMGLSGSLDHILVNAAALAMSTGADHWAINSGESVAMEYSRFNYHSTDFHDPGPYRSSDHDPVVLGLQVGKK